MTEKEVILCNKLIAAGGWIRRARDKWKVLAWVQTEHALSEAQGIIDGAIEFMRGPQDGQHDKKL